MPDLPEEEPVEETTQAKAKRLEKLVAENVKIETDLIRQNVGVQPWVLVNMRIDMLLNAILDDDERYDFEIESAKNVHAILMAIQQQTAAKRGGLSLPKSAPLILPGA